LYKSRYEIGAETRLFELPLKGLVLLLSMLTLFYFMAKDTFYFSHDYNARNDEKIRKLLFKHGYEGYGIYWALIENLYNNANALQTDYDSIAYELRTDSDLVKSVINDFKLFVIYEDNFSSDSVERRLKDRLEKSVKAKKSAKIRWDNANALRTQNEGNAIKERKGKERKGNIVNKDLKDFEINDTQIGSCIEYIKLTKQKTVSKDFILRLFAVFKLKTKDKFYNNEADLYSHFLNSLKYEKLEDEKIPVKTNDDKAKSILDSI